MVVTTISSLMPPQHGRALAPKVMLQSSFGFLSRTSDVSPTSNDCHLRALSSSYRCTEDRLRMQSRIRVCHRIFRTFVAIKAQNSSVGNGEHLIAKISDLTSRNAALARSLVVHSRGALGVTVQWPIPIEAVATPPGRSRISLPLLAHRSLPSDVLRGMPHGPAVWLLHSAPWFCWTNRCVFGSHSASFFP